MNSDLSDQLQYAMYMPAISPGYGEVAANPTPPRPMPKGLTPHDLNFLDPGSKLFHLPCCLYSPGIVRDLTSPEPTMLDTRDKDTSHVLADSGGYQIISGKLHADTIWARKQIFDWQRRHCDFGMTLDVPTAAIANEKSDYTEFNECLADTYRHLKDYQVFYDNKKFPLLNVMQGRSGGEADTWYDVAKKFKFDGWAFAGHLKADYYEVIRRILIMIEEGRISERENWIHFLGKGTFSFGVLLTVLRDSIIRKTGLKGFHISFDTSSPGQAAGRYRKVYTTPKFTAKSFTISHASFPYKDYRYYGSSEPFQWQYSPIAKYLTMGDLIVKNQTHANSRMDMLSACYLMNHNYYVYSKAMIEANELLTQHPALIVSKVPVFIQDAKKAIEDIFAAGDSVATLNDEKAKKVLERV